MVKEVKEKTIVASVKQPNGGAIIQEIPYGLLVWATGNAPRPLVKSLIQTIPAQSGSRRGLLVNDFLVVEGTEGIWYFTVRFEVILGHWEIVRLRSMLLLLR